MPRMDKLSTYKTDIICTNGMIAITYHNTLIVDVAKDGTITLNSDGYQTVTTKRKMNQAANQFGLGFSVFQKNYEWFVTLPTGETVDFDDGMTFKRA